MCVLIRRAGVEDAAGIALVQVESWRTTYAGIVPDSFLSELSVAGQTPGWADRLASPEMIAFVAVHHEGVVGFIAGGAIRQPVLTCDSEVYALYLLLSAQRQGIGRTLVSALASALLQNGFQSAAVLVLKKNPSLPFYFHLAATQVAEQEIEIAGAMLTELVLYWPSLKVLVDSIEELSGRPGR